MIRSYILVLLCVLFIGTKTYATSAPLPKASFGGKIILTQIPGVTCNGQYWLVQKPSGGFPIQGPLFIQSTKKTLSPGGSILGLLNPVPTTQNCYIPTPTGPVYIPSWTVDTKNFNTSKMKR